MRSKTIIDLYAYWDELRRRRDVPDRGQIEPAHIRTLLAELFILERTPRAGIRFRLAGTRICALFQRELRGSAFDALWRGEQIGRMARLAAEVMAQKMPVVLCASALAANGDQVGTEIILLPLKSPDGAVDRIVGALAPLSKPHWLEATPVNYLRLGDIRTLDTEKASLLRRDHAETSPPRTPSRLPEKTFSGAIRRVLHLSVLDGGRRD